MLSYFAEFREHVSLFREHNSGWRQYMDRVIAGGHDRLGASVERVVVIQRAEGILGSLQDFRNAIHQNGDSVPRGNPQNDQHRIQINLWRRESEKSFQTHNRYGASRQVEYAFEGRGQSWGAQELGHRRNPLYSFRWKSGQSARQAEDDKRAPGKGGVGHSTYVSWELCRCFL
jgi:hypothetical protein